MPNVLMTSEAVEAQGWSPFIGFFAILLLAWVFSENRFQVRWRAITAAISLQFVLAFLVLGPGQSLFQKVGGGFLILVAAYEEGIQFLLGPQLGADHTALALTILPMVIFVASLSAILYHYRILQGVVAIFAWVFQKTLRMSGPEAVAAAGNIFLGMAEAPTLIAPYVNRLSRSQLFAVMVTGMATVSGSLLVVYSKFAGPLFGSGDEGVRLAAAHLLTASVISAPAAFCLARLMIPEQPDEMKDETSSTPVPIVSKGFFDALTQGAITGLKLTAQIAAVLLVMITLIKLVNRGLVIWNPDWSLEGGLGIIFGPLARLMGVPPQDLAQAGQLLGLKVGANEFLAYLQMGQMTFVSQQSALILTYSLCGFANFGSIGIMIGSLAGLCPERREEIASLGLKAMGAGFLSTCLTGTVVGGLFPWITF